MSENGLERQCGARLCFSSLPPRSIHSWEEFRDRFFKQYYLNTTQFKDTRQLSNVSQNVGEALSYYLDKFNKARVEVGVFYEAYAIKTFIAGLLHGPLLEENDLSPRHSLHDLLTIDNQYAQKN